MESKEEKLKSTVFFVEADSFTQHALWKQWHDKNIGWEEDNSGFGSCIGNIGKKKREVWVSFMFAKIFGKRICFYHATSRFVDHTMIEKYLETNYPVKWDKGTRRAMCDADNFHLAMDACKNG